MQDYFDMSFFRLDRNDLFLEKAPNSGKLLIKMTYPNSVYFTKFMFLISCNYEIFS